MSHTKELIEEALDKVEKYLEEKHSEEIPIVGARTGINQYLHKVGIHVTRLKEWEMHGFDTSFSAKLSSLQFLRIALADSEQFDETYCLLNDDESRNTFNWYVKFHIAHAFVGEKAYELFLPPVTKELWQAAQSQLKRVSKDSFKVENFVITGSPGELAATFLFQQYRYKDIVKPECNEIVLDVGAYVGDTTLWFSARVGSHGKVYAFEPEPNNLEKLFTNISRNRIENVVAEGLGLSNVEGELKMISGAGSSKLTNGDKGVSVSVTTVDRYVEQNQIKRLDFIKMDVEGHEADVIEGASTSIQKFKPKLAVSVYHRGSDLATLPHLVHELNHGYKLYLKHCTPGLSETVLFAIDQSTTSGQKV